MAKIAIQHSQFYNKFGFCSQIRNEAPHERAGGYKCGIAAQRALQEAMQGLFHYNASG